MPTTINSISTDANALYTALANDLSIELNLPALEVVTDFPVPVDPSLPQIDPLTIAELTTATTDGTGVFDVLMKAVNAHLEKQFKANRITGAEYAKVYLGSITAVMQFGTQFLLSKDRAQLENLQILETVKLAQVQTVKAHAELQLVRAQIQTAYYQAAEMRLKAYTLRNAYAQSKMDLVLGYNNVLEAESKQKLTNAQYQATYAQTHDTLDDGTPVTGVVGADRVMKELQGQLVGEQYELARSEVRDTLSTGGTFAGMTAIKKATAEAQRKLTLEQLDTQRAQTKETLEGGGAIQGLVSKEKATKEAQIKLILEQYETQRGQTRGTLSTGEGVLGLVGAQTRLYDQQIVSYKRDAENKAVKMLLDTWTARKTIDEGVAVPVALDVPAIETIFTTYKNNLTL